MIYLDYTANAPVEPEVLNTFCEVERRCLGNANARHSAGRQAHAEMEKAIEMLTAVKESIITAYEHRTGLDRKTLAKMMSEETWMDCHKAIELGFADGILERDTAPVTDPAKPVLFSQRAVDNALMNRLVVASGVPVKLFYDRLEQLK